jgi:hypothetical protein
MHTGAHGTVQVLRVIKYTRAHRALRRIFKVMKVQKCIRGLSAFSMQVHTLGVITYRYRYSGTLGRVSEHR